MRVTGTSLLATATAIVVCTSGALLWAPDKASAQINIEGLIRGALSHRGGGYHSRSRHSRSHVSSRREHENSAPQQEKDATEQDATKVDNKMSSSSSSHQPSGPVQNIPQSVESDAPASAAAANTPNDEPAFAPVR